MLDNLLLGRFIFKMEYLKREERTTRAVDPIYRDDDPRNVNFVVQTDLFERSLSKRGGKGVWYAGVRLGYGHCVYEKEQFNCKYEQLGQTLARLIDGVESSSGVRKLSVYVSVYCLLL